MHQAGLILVMEGLGYPWGGNPPFLDVMRYKYTYNEVVGNVQFNMGARYEAIDETKDIVSTSFMNHNSNPSYSGMYLRGGGVTYRISNNWGYTVRYQDGSDASARDVLYSYTSNNLLWYVSPKDWADRVAPVARFTARTARGSTLENKVSTLEG